MENECFIHKSLCFVSMERNFAWNLFWMAQMLATLSFDKHCQNNSSYCTLISRDKQVNIRAFACGRCAIRAKIHCDGRV